VLADAEGSALCVRVCLDDVVADLRRPVAPLVEKVDGFSRDVGVSAVDLEVFVAENDNDDDAAAADSSPAVLSPINDTGLPAILD
jgi:hypothetical protein